MQPSPLATGSPLSYNLLGDGGKKGRGEKQLKNIPEQRSYFGILIYKKRKKNRNESQDPVASSGADEILASGCRTAALPPFLCSDASTLKLRGLRRLRHNLSSFDFRGFNSIANPRRRKGCECQHGRRAVTAGNRARAVIRCCVFWGPFPSSRGSLGCPAFAAWA